MTTPLKSMGASELRCALITETEDTEVQWSNDTSQQMFVHAVEHVQELHDGQYRQPRGNCEKPPYVEHPLRNTLRLVRWGCQDGEVLIASLLHDTVEDCAHRLIDQPKKKVDPVEARQGATEVLTQVYGTNVTHIVIGVSNPILPSKASHVEKVNSYVDHIVSDDPQVQAVKTTDLYDNPGSLYHSITEAFAPRARRMHTKYAMALPVFMDSIVDEGVAGLSGDDMLRHLSKVQSNLDKADEMLKAV